MWGRNLARGLPDHSGRHACRHARAPHRPRGAKALGVPRKLPAPRRHAQLLRPRLLRLRLPHRLPVELHAAPGGATGAAR
jgi:hypothetical protein